MIYVVIALALSAAWLLTRLAVGKRLEVALSDLVRAYEDQVVELKRAVNIRDRELGEPPSFVIVTRREKVQDGGSGQ